VYSLSVIARILAMRHNVVDSHNIDSWRFPDPSVFNGAYPLERALRESDFIAERSDDFERTAAIFADDASRELMRQLFAFRALGPFHVQLQSDLSVYFEAFEEAKLMRIGSSGMVMPPFEVSIYQLDFLGYRITAECWLGNIVLSFLLEQYFFSRNDVTVAPAEDDYIIDAGGCFGDTALAFAAAVGENGRVFSFEPVPRNAAVLKSNIARNSTLGSRIEFYDKAMSDQLCGSITFTDEGAASKQSPDGRITVDTISIDAFVQERGVKIDFIKADIEGAEIKMLAGAVETIQKFKPKLAISAYHRQDDVLIIPQIIKELEPSYEIFLGHHTIHSEETIVYAISRPKVEPPRTVVVETWAACSAVGIVALLPFLVEGALSLNVLRALRAKGADVAVAYCANGGGGYTPDPMTDFAEENRLIDLSEIPPNLLRDRLCREFETRETRLALQIGALALYPVLPYVKERLPTLRVVDILYNEVGHSLNHFLYEACFDGVIVESQHMARFVRNGTLKPDPNVLVVESGIDLDRFSPGGRRPGEAPLRIGYVGRFTPEKNPLGFIDLFERLAERLPRLTGAIAGEGPMSEEIRTRLAASPAADRLKYLGRVPMVSDVLHAIDVLIVPSTLDGRPNVVMEANACGLPVIGAPVGGIPELIEQGRNGYLAGPSEVDRIAHWLRMWDEHPQLLSAISSTSRSYAEAHFDKHQMVVDYAAAFSQCAGTLQTE
jgi:FkbM family methyltransferase